MIKCGDYIVFNSACGIKKEGKIIGMSRRQIWVSCEGVTVEIRGKQFVSYVNPKRAAQLLALEAISDEN